MNASALVLGERLVMTEARERLEALTAAVDALPAGAPAALDAGALAHFDTGALAVLLGLQRHCQRTGHALHVLGLPVRLKGLADLYGIGALVPAAA